MFFHILRSDGEDNNADISRVGPGAYGASGESLQVPPSVYMERMCTDINSLKKQYDRLKQRQNQAHIIIAAASASQQQQQKKPKIITPKIETPTALNHLFVGRNSGTTRNRCVTASPRIASVYPQLSSSQLSRKNNIQKNSTLESAVKAQSSPTSSNVENGDKTLRKDRLDENFNNSAQVKDSMNDFSDSTSKKVDEISICSKDNGKCDTAQESKENYGESSGNHSREEQLTTRFSDSVESQNSSVVECHSSQKSEEGNTENQSSRTNDNDSFNENSEINRNDTVEKEQCNSCDSHRHSIMIEGSDGILVCSDASNDSGIYSTASSIDVENSPKTVSEEELSPCSVKKKEVGSSINNNNNSAVLWEESVENKSSIETNEVKLPSNGVTEIPKSLAKRSISEDNNENSTEADIQSGRSRSFSTDQALSDYARSKSKPAKMIQPFNPFPVKHFNENRKKNCVKLGLYKTSTLQEFERQCKSKFLWSK